MKEETKKVMHKSTQVGEVTVPIYESFEELQNSEEEAHILNMFNKQNMVRIMGNERAKHGGTKAGKKKRMQLAYNLLTTVQLTEVAQDYDALQALLDSPEIQAQVDAALETQEAA